MATLNVYKSSFPSCKVHLPSGKECNFVAGEYATADEKEIEFLASLVASGHPHIYVDSGKATKTAEIVQPLEAIKKKAIEEYLASQSAEAKPAAAATAIPTPGVKVTLPTSAAVAK